MITEHDLELLLMGDKATIDKLAESLLRMAADWCFEAINKSRPANFSFYYRKGKEGKPKLTEHDWDSDFRSAAGMGIARGFHEWKRASRNPTNPPAFISYVLKCVDLEIANAWRQKSRWKRLSNSKTAEQLRYRNPDFVEWIEDKPKDFRFNELDFRMFVEELPDEERIVFLSQGNIEETARMLGDGTSVYRVKKLREKLRSRIEKLEALAA